MSAHSMARRTSYQSADQWWLDASRLSSLVTRLNLLTCDPTFYKFGDAFLQVHSDGDQVHRHLQRMYGERRVALSKVDSSACTKCAVSTTSTPALTYVRFYGPEAPDAMGLALDLLEHPVGSPLYSECDSFRVPGWRLISSRKDDSTPIAVARGSELFVDTRRAPPDLLSDYLVNPILSRQRELLFIHAGSIEIGGAGALLIGPTGTGKTTISLALACRGHGFFGDDVSAVQLSSGEALPFCRVANVRPGPRASAVDRMVAGTPCTDGIFADGKPRFQVPMGSLFPSEPGSLTIRSAFFLRSFAAKPRAERFVPKLEKPESFQSLPLNNTVLTFWGISAERRLMQFLLFIRLLSNLRCYFLDVGPPEETADLIEEIMEEL